MHRPASSCAVSRVAQERDRRSQRAAAVLLGREQGGLRRERTAQYWVQGRGVRQHFLCPQLAPPGRKDRRKPSGHWPSSGPAGRTRHRRCHSGQDALRRLPPAATWGDAPDCKDPPFDFLGFTHSWGKSRKGKDVVRQTTAKSRFARSLAAVKEWCRTNQPAPACTRAARLAVCGTHWSLRLLRRHGEHSTATGLSPSGRVDLAQVAGTTNATNTVHLGQLPSAPASPSLPRPSLAPPPAWKLSRVISCHRRCGATGEDDPGPTRRHSSPSPRSSPSEVRLLSVRSVGVALVVIILMEVFSTDTFRRTFRSRYVG
jgi:hypothetical protein